ncbi:MAG: hypothetical protein V4562_02350 [Pseudomonadota bacterium]
MSGATDPGRSCPLAYRYSAAVFDRPPELQTETLYVVGGLYGNICALDAIEALFAHEVGPKRMVFNGDFHWFDADAALFAQVDQRVTGHYALRGNVETELANDDDSAGCGCAYPDDVDDGAVARSNAILLQLRGVARQHPALRARLGQLPMHAVAQVGDSRIGIVHGDAESLAGWRFDPAALDNPAGQPWLQKVFAQAGVDIFASSHTCAPALRKLAPRGLVINNGAAGMASLRGRSSGLLTRISLHPAPTALPVVQQIQSGNTHIQSVRVDFDNTRWQQQFLALWPAGSAAHVSYWQRITRGLPGAEERALL